jgi:hypothetical protein
MDASPFDEPVSVRVFTYQYGPSAPGIATISSKPCMIDSTA